MNLRILLVDDEPLACQRMRDLLDADSNVQVVGTAAGVEEATAAIADYNPDLVFLDVCMPGLDGFHLARMLGGETRPLVVLVTAHARFAVDAFEVRALDYLLKPVRPERLRCTLALARERLKETPACMEPGSRCLSRLVVRSQNRTEFVRTADIEWIEAAGNYMVVRASGRSHIVRETMAALEKELPQDSFFRLNRSTLVHVNAVAELRLLESGCYEARLRDGKGVMVTRSLRELEKRIRSAAC